MSDTAGACPHCGHINKKVANRSIDSKQKAGCFIVVLGIFSLALLPNYISYPLMVVGLVVIILNTRFR